MDGVSDGRLLNQLPDLQSASPLYANIYTPAHCKFEMFPSPVLKKLKSDLPQHSPSFKLIGNDGGKEEGRSNCKAYPPRFSCLSIKPLLLHQLAQYGHREQAPFKSILRLAVAIFSFRAFSPINPHLLFSQSLLPSPTSLPSPTRIQNPTPFPPPPLPHL